MLLGSACVTTVLQMPEPAFVELDWVVYELPESALVFSAPPNAVASDRPGCYLNDPQRTPASGHAPPWESFCLWLHPPGQPIPIFTAANRSVCQNDCLTYDKVSTERLTLAGKDVIVQAALVTGGPENKVRSPELLVQIPVPQGLALLQAVFVDGDGAAQILGIAQTVSGASQTSEPAA